MFLLCLKVRVSLALTAMYWKVPTYVSAAEKLSFLLMPKSQIFTCHSQACSVCLRLFFLRGGGVSPPSCFHGAKQECYLCVGIHQNVGRLHVPVYNGELVV